MKRSYIWLICLVVCIAFISLLYLQGRYAKEMIRMRQEQFDENVWRSLDQASRDLEKAETFRYLQKVLNQHDNGKTKMVHPDSLSRQPPHYPHTATRHAIAQQEKHATWFADNEQIQQAG